MTFISHSEDETAAFAESLAKSLPGAPTYLLYGDLGAGKTAFTRGLARGYGSSSRVSSPTFTLVHEYDGPTPVYHFDLYRLGTEEELYDIGFDDYFRPGTVRVIEWPDAFSDRMPPDAVTIRIRRGDEADVRIIDYTLPTEGSDSE